MKHQYFLLVTLSVILLASCETSKYIYTPSTANMLVPDQKGSLKVAANYSNSSSSAVADNDVAKSAGADLQTAYGISDRVSLKLDAWFKDEHNSGNLSKFEYEHIRYRKRGFDLSGGIYSRGSKKDHMFQLYAGAGLGNLSFNSVVTDDIGMSFRYFHRVNYLKFFLQPVFAVNISERNRLSTGFKLNMLNYSNLRSDYPNLDQQSFGHITDKPSFFFDAVLHDEFGFKGLKNLTFQAQIGLTRLLTTFNYQGQYFFQKQRYDYNNLWTSVGIIYSLKIR